MSDTTSDTRTPRQVDPRHPRQAALANAYNAVHHAHQHRRHRSVGSITPVTLRVLRALLIDDDAGGTGYTVPDLARRTRINPSECLRQIHYAIVALHEHAADTGVQVTVRDLVRGRQRNKIYGISVRPVCPVCLGTGRRDDDDAGEITNPA